MWYLRMNLLYRTFTEILSKLAKQTHFQIKRKGENLNYSKDPGVPNFLRSKTKLRKLVNNQARKLSTLARKVQAHVYLRRKILETTMHT